MACPPPALFNSVSAPRASQGWSGGWSKVKAAMGFLPLTISVYGPPQTFLPANPPICPSICDYLQPHPLTLLLPHLRWPLRNSSDRYGAMRIRTRINLPCSLTCPLSTNPSIGALEQGEFFFFLTKITVRLKSNHPQVPASSSSIDHTSNINGHSTNTTLDASTLSSLPHLHHDGLGPISLGQSSTGIDPFLDASAGCS